jgi:hypothetical protein
MKATPPVLSAWVADDGAHFEAKVGQWKAAGEDEAAAWGQLLAGAVRHIADAMRADHGARKDDTMDGIIDAMLESLNDPHA